MWELFAFYQITLGNRITMQKEACIYSWTRGSQVKLNKLIQHYSSPEETINAYILSQAQASSEWVIAQ